MPPYLNLLSFVTDHMSPDQWHRALEIAAEIEAAAARIQALHPSDSELVEGLPVWLRSIARSVIRHTTSVPAILARVGLDDLDDDAAASAVATEAELLLAA